jgi:8-oxo-dGTP diphosphatase
VSDVVRAAGGVPLRVADGVVEVLIVHRPRYDDWTFPKGKCEADETEEDCALREVEEETGLRCELGAELPSTTYTDPRGRPKTVRYWLLEVVGGDLAFENEVADARWVTPALAASTLSYGRDVEILDAAVRAAPNAGSSQPHDRTTSPEAGQVNG